MMAYDDEPEIEPARDIIVLPEYVKEWEERGYRVVERFTDAKGDGVRMEPA